MNKSSLTSHPRRTAFSIALLFVLIIALGTLGFGALFNAVQKARLDVALQSAQERGEVVNQKEIEQRFPRIEFF